MKPKKWEIICVLGLVALLTAWALWPKSPGSRVQVSVNGQVLGSYPLEQDRRVPLTGYGGYALTLVIGEGKAHVEDSQCPDLICQHHAPISGAGEQIVCLPARIVIAVTGEEDTIDAVTQ